MSKPEVLPNILALETATSVCAVALFREARFLAETTAPSAQSHHELLPGMVEELLKSAGMTPSSIDLAAVSIGPGSFSGLRVGLSYGKGFAMGINADLVPVNTLEGLARCLRDDLKDQDQIAQFTLLPVTTARKGEVFAQSFSASCGSITAEGEPFLGGWEELLAHVKPPAVIGGVGLRTLLKETDRPLPEGIILRPDVKPSARIIGERAWDLWRGNTTVYGKFDSLEPRYLKEFTLRAVSRG